MPGPALVWFRDDHRVADNPALSAAIESGAPVLCIYIHDERSPGLRPLGGAARWWLHGSLDALGLSLRERGAELRLFTGPAAEVIERIVTEARPSGVFWNRRYGAAETAVDQTIKARLAGLGVTAESFNGRLLHEPWEIKSKAGTPFHVYTPYLRAVLAAGEPAAPLAAPARIDGGSWPASLTRESVALADLALEPSKPDWASGFRAVFERGEIGATERLSRFVAGEITGYGENRNRPGIQGTSRLSPHLRFGEISPQQVWHAVRRAARSGEIPKVDADKLISEVVWRDFTYQLLFEHPDLASKHYSRRFDRLGWADDPVGLEAWRHGRTGFPIVDAGMRQLWTTGWMHNRVRMIVASFLVKDLLIDWRKGEGWFWDTLVDADPANNAFSWQWVSGSGPDSAPFHRIFNPAAQGEKFDPDGAYVSLYVPELARLPASHIHRPWTAPPDVLEEANVELGRSYPRPIVAHEAARDRALEAFRATRDAAA